MDHLPECIQSADEPVGVVCICDRLRACEQRYEAERRPIDVRATQLAVQHGFEQGVQAAYSAVELRWAKEPDAASDWLLIALAAIDALRNDNV